MTSRWDRVLLLGIDGVPPRQLDAFRDEGILPNLDALIRRGTRFGAVPTLPAITAPGWAAIASGCSPGRLGIENILLPTLGRHPSDICNGFDARLAKADFIWKILANAGRSAVVMKFPGSWPPQPGNFVQIDGAGGYADIKCRFEALSSTAYRSEVEDPDAPGAVFPEGYLDRWRIDGPAGASVKRIRPRKPADWDLGAGCEPVFEFVMASEQGARPVFALACRMNGQPRLALASGKGGPILALLGVGEWSGWFTVGDRGGYSYRYKLLALSLEEEQVHVYQTEGHLRSGFAKPPELAEQLCDAVGPPIEWTGTFDFLNGLVDLDTQLELYRLHTDWLCRALDWLASRQPWHGIFLHWHVLEYAHHLVGASLSAEHPLHDPTRAKRDCDFLREVYRLGDRLVGSAGALCDGRTGLVLASDHGHDLVHSLFFINHWLASEGWLVLNGGTIDWTRTIAYGIFPGCIYVNDRLRWSAGIVEPADIARHVARIQSRLLLLTDPRTGRRMVTHALAGDDLRAWGQTGARSPDVFVCLDRGYEAATRIVPAELDTVLKTTVPYRDETSGHGSFHPQSASARTLAVFAGPGIPAAECRAEDISVTDITPTILDLLGLDLPAQCTGKPVRFRQDALHESAV